MSGLWRAVLMLVPLLVVLAVFVGLLFVMTWWSPGIALATVLGIIFGQLAAWFLIEVYS